MKEWHLGVETVGENDFLNNKSRVELINISHKDHHEESLFIKEFNLSDFTTCYNNSLVRCHKVKIMQFPSISYYIL